MLLRPCSVSPTHGPIVAQTLDNLNMGFTVIFTLELFTNFVAHRFRDFISNSWCASASPTMVGVCRIPVGAGVRGAIALSSGSSTGRPRASGRRVRAR